MSRAKNTYLQTTGERAEKIPVIKNKLEKTDNNRITLSGINLSLLPFFLHIANLMDIQEDKEDIQEQVKVIMVIGGVDSGREVADQLFDDFINNARILKLNLLADALKNLKQNQKEDINHLIKTIDAYIQKKPQSVRAIANAMQAEPSDIGTFINRLPQDLQQKISAQNTQVKT